MFLVVAGTNRPGSNTLKVARLVHGALLAAEQPAELLDLGELPLEVFSPAAYAEKPAAFAPYQDAVDRCRAILTVVPEYNGSFPGVLKIFVDLLRFPGSLAELPAAFVGLSAGVWGGIRAVEQLEMVFQYRFAHLFSRRLFLPHAHQALDADGQLTDPAQRERLDELLAAFVRFSAAFPERAVIVARSMDPRWLSNTYLVADRPGGEAVLIDTGAPTEAILARVRELDLRVTHALCTHHHVDHVAHNADYKAALGVCVCGHAAEAELFGDLDRTLADGEELAVGGLRIRALHIPGHTVGQLAFVVNDAKVFTGDTLFKGSVGGTRGPGHATFAELQRSIVDVLLALPPETEVLPGHTEPTTVDAERRTNPFVRAWQGDDRVDERPCVAFGQPATLLLRAADYDGGTKCWVRFADGREDTVPGSAVREA